MWTFCCERYRHSFTLLSSISLAQCPQNHSHPHQASEWPLLSSSMPRWNWGKGTASGRTYCRQESTVLCRLVSKNSIKLSAENVRMVTWSESRHLVPVDIEVPCYPYQHFLWWMGRQSPAKGSLTEETPHFLIDLRGIEPTFVLPNTGELLPHRKWT